MLPQRIIIIIILIYLLKGNNSSEIQVNNNSNLQKLMFQQNLKYLLELIGQYLTRVRTEALLSSVCTISI